MYLSKEEMDKQSTFQRNPNKEKTFQQETIIWNKFKLIKENSVAIAKEQNT